MNHRGGVKAVIGDTVTVVCHVCGKDASHDVSDYSPKFLAEFQEYENLTLKCPHCASEGKEVWMTVNINIPEFEEDEVDVVEAIMDTQETNARRFIRNLMWAKRPDLKKKNRAAEIQKYVARNKDKIKKMREEGAKMRAQMKGLNKDARKDESARNTSRRP